MVVGAVVRWSGVGMSQVVRSFCGDSRSSSALLVIYNSITVLLIVVCM